MEEKRERERLERFATVSEGMNLWQQSSVGSVQGTSWPGSGRDLESFRKWEQPAFLVFRG